MSRNQKKIAYERVRILYRLAQENYKDHPSRSKRYTELIKRIAERTRIRLPREIRRGICRGCGVILLQGVNARTRIRQRREPHLTITCLDCGHISRMPIGRKKQ